MTAEVGEAKEVGDVCPLLSIAFRTLYPCIRERCRWWMAVGCALEALVDITVMAEALEAKGD